MAKDVLKKHSSSGFLISEILLFTGPALLRVRILNHAGISPFGEKRTERGTAGL